MKTLKKILITAGPTREMLDPVRFLSNLSTGHMGYTIARVASSQKYRVTLVSGPTPLKPPAKVKFVAVVSPQEMKKACERLFPRHDVLIMTAAVCDFTPQHRHAQKIHRTKTTQLLLKRTPDIVAGLARRKGKRLVIGFSLETQNWLENAARKLRRKKLDGIVANYYTPRHIPFGGRKINVAFLDKRGRAKLLRGQSKDQVARHLLSWIKQWEGFKK